MSPEPQKRYLILLEGQGGELDRRGADNEEDISAAIRDLGYTCTFAAGDTIRIIDTQPED